MNLIDCLKKLVISPLFKFRLKLYEKFPIVEKKKLFLLLLISKLNNFIKLMREHKCMK